MFTHKISSLQTFQTDLTKVSGTLEKWLNMIHVLLVLSLCQKNFKMLDIHNGLATQRVNICTIFNAKTLDKLHHFYCSWHIERFKKRSKTVSWRWFVNSSLRQKLYLLISFFRNGDSKFRVKKRSHENPRKLILQFLIPYNHEKAHNCTLLLATFCELKTFQTRDLIVGNE